MTADRLHSLLAAFRTKRLLVLGDVMLDRFITGNVTRISPEAPVPVVEVKDEASYPGGAANVARNLLPFCARVSVAGLAGDDAAGADLAALLDGAGIDTRGLLRDADTQTIVKTRICARSQQLVRIDRETKRPLSAAQLARVLPWLEEQLREADAVIIEDYAKGFITQPLADAVAAAVRREGKVLTIDPNPGNPLAWKAATAIKPNRSEALHAAGLTDAAVRALPGLPGLLDELGRRLFGQWEAAMLLITLSEQGMALLQPGQAPYHLPTQAREVFDVSGAGDTAIALFTLALASGATPAEAAEISNHASGVVVGKSGTATLTPAELLASFADSRAA